MNKKYINPKVQRLHNNSVLVTLANREYIDQAKQLFSSAYWNAGWQGDYLLLAHEIPEKDLKWFRDKGIKIYKCRPLWKEKIYGHMNTAVLSKFYLFKPYFKRWKTIVYIDADIIIKASLEKLIEKPTLPGFSAVMDDYTKLKINFHSNAYKELSRRYNLDKGGFNSGFLVINTRIINKKMFNDLKDFISRDYPRIRMEDQAILNMYFYDKWKRLPMLYNVLMNTTHSNYLLDTTKVRGIIIHFAYKPKQWDKKNKFYAEWKNNLRLAEDIDLKARKEPSKIWRDREIIVYTAYLKIRFSIVKVYTIMNNQIDKLKEAIRRMLYSIGRVIKRISPKLYFTLGGKN